MIMASWNASHLHLHEGVMNGRDYFANFFMQPTVVETTSAFATCVGGAAGILIWSFAILDNKTNTVYLYSSFL